MAATAAGVATTWALVPLAPLPMPSGPAVNETVVALSTLGVTIETFWSTHRPEMALKAVVLGSVRLPAQARKESWPELAFGVTA